MKHKGGKGGGGKGKASSSSSSSSRAKKSALSLLAEKQRSILLRGGGGGKSASPAPVRNGGGRTGAAATAAAAPSLASVANPFDRFANSRKKHEVVNRRVKGEDRNVGRARDKAVEDRKKRLLQDYQSSKKSNSFQDKRFGEQDATMSLDEKMFMRFQKERLKKARNASLFNLDSDRGPEDQLTHKGQLLGDGNMGDEDDFEDEDGDDDDKGLGRDVVNSLHFGGGLVPKQSEHYGPSSLDSGGTMQPKSRLDALQEIVMKSKLHKMEKKEAKEEQESERLELDKAFAQLVSESAVEFRPVRSYRPEDEDKSGPFSEYDKSLNAMAFESKVRASDRTKTAEEIALADKEKMEELEAARVKRMRGAAEGDSSAVDEALRGQGGKGGKGGKGSKGGKTKQQAKRRKTDDDIDGDEEYADGDIVTNNYGWNEEDEEEEGEGEGEGEEEGGADDEDDDEEEEEEDDEDGDDEEGEEEEQEEQDEQEEVAVGSRCKVKKSISASDVNDAMPHILPCPGDLETLDGLIEKYVTSAKDLEVLLTRIVAYHSVHLPAPAGPANRLLLSSFFEILLKLFVRVGDSLSAPTDFSPEETMGVLDHLTVLIYKVTKDLTETAPQIWGKNIRLLQQQLQNRLRDYAQGTRSSCWPSLGRLLLLKVVGHVFAVTDFRHAIVSPCSLLLCQYLMQCPVSTASDAASGMLATAILLGYTAETKRLVPEALSFVNSTIRLFLPSAAEPSEVIGMMGTFDKAKLASLREAAASAHEFSVPSSRIPWKYMSAKQGGAGKGFTPEFARALLGSAYSLVTAIVTRHDSSSALPELLFPLIESLQLLRPQSSPHVLPKALQQAHLTLLSFCTAAAQTQRVSRKPLQWRNVETQSIETKAPKFQLDYTFKKDTDADADRAKMKQLTRQLKCEEKAAMRELRRDGEFLDRESFREKTEASDKRRNERAKNFAFMEEQQATINMQIRKGGGLMKGGGSGVIPRQARSKDAKRKR